MSEVTEREIRIFVAKNDRKPFLDWMSELSVDVRGKIRSRLNRIRMGNFGDSKALGDGVYELRFNFGPGYRAYYGLDGKKIVLLLMGGDKSTQKKDIIQAKEYWNEYQENKESYEREL